MVEKGADNSDRSSNIYGGLMEQEEQEEEKRSKNANLHKAKEEKNDEFYTQYADIENEVNAYLDYDENVFKDKIVLCPCNDGPDSNFTKLFCDMFGIWGLKKLICVSYDKNGQGKAGILDHDPGILGRSDMVWTELMETGDFRSKEVTEFLKEADIVITNPPFSLFREFMAWIKKAGDKKFLVIGNKNAVACKEIFPDIKNNKLWFGPGAWASMSFTTPDGEVNYVPAIWFTNIDHGIRHDPLELSTMEDNIRYGLCKELREWKKYPKYDNYDAIEVPRTVCIPSDYPGVMGVPISFLGSYCPEQFEIIGATQRDCHPLFPDTKKYDKYWEVTNKGKKTGASGKKLNENAVLEQNDGIHNYCINTDGRIVQSLYSRIFIKHKNPKESKK